jgi:PAS domain S-box-containing protein
LKKLHVVVIEPSESDALIIAELLYNSELIEYEISHLYTLKETQEFLQKNQVDIILVNLFLDDSYGIHTFDQLFHSYPEIPFLVLTEIGDYQIGVNAVKKGAQDYHIKNEISGNILDRSITYAIERKSTERELRKSEEKYRELFIRSKDAIYISTVDGQFVDINPAGLALFQYTVDDMTELQVKDLYVDAEDRERLQSRLANEGEVSDYELILQRKDGIQLNCLLSTMVIFDEDNTITGYQGIIRDITEKKRAEAALIQSLRNLDQANKELSFLNSSLEEQVQQRTEQLQREKELAESQHHEISESIQYAKRIQASILPPLSKIKQSIPDSFVYYQPKDVVSGDFYWFDKVNSKPLMAVVDCTGHGVPGAFMSIIGYTQLNEIVSDRRITDPGVILKELDKRVRLALNQNSPGDKNSKDGMECGLISINLQQKKLEYSGAMRPLYMVKNSNLHIIKGDKCSIGGVSRKGKEFTTHRINIEEGDCFYLFSDGYPDQFGGIQGRKFMTKNVGIMLQGIAHLPMLEQGKIVKNTIQQWMQNEEQIDDILMVGIKF